MSTDPFDPFEAWKNYQERDIRKELLQEELDVSKLHDPQDFAKEVGEFVTETSAHLKALQDFSHHHEVARTNPKFGAALDKVAQAMEVLNREQSQLKLPQVPESQGAPAKTFKKI
jgi:hypothetical protein